MRTNFSLARREVNSTNKRGVAATRPHFNLIDGPNIQINIEGESGSMDVRALTTALSNFVEYLNDIDRGLSKNPKGTIDWVVTDLRMGSMQCRLHPVSRNLESNYGSDVIRYGVDGLDNIQSSYSSPAYSTLQGMNKAMNMVGIVRKGYGATGIAIITDERKIELTPRFIENIKELTKPKRQSIGSVEGVLETISLHKKPHFTIYSSVTKKAINCNFVPDQFLSQIKSVLGHRVNVSGRVFSNIKGEPLYVNVEKIRYLRSSTEMSKEAIEMPFKGIAPDFTGGTSSEDYIKEMRRER